MLEVPGEVPAPAFTLLQARAGKNNRLDSMFGEPASYKSLLRHTIHLPCTMQSMVDVGLTLAGPEFNRGGQGTPPPLRSFSTSASSMAAPDNQGKSPLTASYTSPTGAKEFYYSLPSLPQHISTEQKTRYLSALRSSVANLQEDVNTFLTAKMEEDKTTAPQVAGKVDDKKEEENYGEETDDNG